MSSPLPPATTGQNNQLSPTQASFVYWLNGFAPVFTNVVTPLIVFWKMGKAPKLPIVKYNQQVNEVVRQFISGTIGLVSYFGGGELTKGAINRVFDANDQKMDESTKQVAMIVGGVAMSFIGFAFVRPYISTDLICRFLKQEKGLEHAIPAEKVQGLLKKYCSPSNLESAKKEVGAIVQKESVVEQAGVKSDNSLIRWAQGKIDRHLVPNGKPNLKKTALVSTVALSGYLTLLAGALWGVNRMLGRKIAPKTQGVDKPFTGNRPLYPSPVVPTTTAAHPGLAGSPNLYFSQRSPWIPFSPMYSGTGVIGRN